MKNFTKVATLGSGVMGAQIAAMFANAGVKVYLFDLPGKQDLNELAKQAKFNLSKIKPSPLLIDSNNNFISACNYETDLDKLKECDLIIEAVAENLDIKLKLYTSIAPFVKDDCLLVSNTSGLSINAISEKLPPNIQPNFMGMHFFNPPRYMQLVELIPANNTNVDLITTAKNYLTTILGKIVVVAKDTPNFIANRVGVFSLLSTIYQAEKYNISFADVDALSGKLIGRPKSGTFRLMDVVGLDVIIKVIETMENNLKSSPWHKFYKAPQWLSEFVKAGNLGQKNKRGIFQKVGNEILVYDLQSKKHIKSEALVSKEVTEILTAKDKSNILLNLKNSKDSQAQFLWSHFQDLFMYCAYNLEHIASTAKDIDFALRYGFGWQIGPFELWQQNGYTNVLQAIKEDIKDKKALTDSLPPYLDNINGFYQDNKYYSASTNTYQADESFTAQEKQIYPPAIIFNKFDEGETVFENDGVRLWHTNDDIGILNFKTKMNSASNIVTRGIKQAVDIASDKFKALVLWQRQGDNFSVGANLVEMRDAIKNNNLDLIDKAIADFQIASMSLRKSPIPTIACVKGLALGGGCEFVLHCDKVVASNESYIGLVELGVGLIPGGGGSKELARRAALAKNVDNSKLFANYFENVAMASVSSSAAHAKHLGFLRADDVIIANPYELLYVAKAQAKAMIAANYRPPNEEHYQAFGQDAMANIKAKLINLREGNFISDYDYFLAEKLAYIMCGGDITTGEMVNDDYLLLLERQVFSELVQQEKTYQRIEYMLKTHKPLRN